MAQEPHVLVQCQKRTNTCFSLLAPGKTENWTEISRDFGFYEPPIDRVVQGRRRRAKKGRRRRAQKDHFSPNRKCARKGPFFFFFTLLCATKVFLLQTSLSLSRWILFQRDTSEDASGRRRTEKTSKGKFWHGARENLDPSERAAFIPRGAGNLRMLLLLRLRIFVRLNTIALGDFLVHPDFPR